jgi:hypothetical protein
MLAVFGATEPTVIAFAPIYGFSILADQLDRVIYPASIIGGVKNIPGARVIGMDDRSRCDMFTENRALLNLVWVRRREG